MTDYSTLVSGQGRRNHQQHAEPSAALPRHPAGHHRGRDRPARHALRPHDQPRPRQEEEPGTTSAPPRVLTGAALHQAFSWAQRYSACSRQRSAANTVHGRFIQSFRPWYTHAVIFALDPSRSKVKSKSLWLNMQRKQLSRQSVVSQPRSARSNIQYVLENGQVLKPIIAY